jgi:hypothetical protein
MPAEPTLPYKAKFYTDHVGRRRKLSHGAMLRIMSDFAAGVPTRQLAEEWGVSTSLIRMVCYHTRVERKDNAN